MEKDLEKPNEEEGEEGEEPFSFSIVDNSSSSEMRVTGLYGEVTEEKCSELIYSMLHLRETGKKEVPKDPKNEKAGSITTYDPFEFIISTEGGHASDMFATYDIMRMIKKDCDIKTFGIGKVMSAGVLLLAAGTNGLRSVGKNCRLMLHPVKAGHAGYLHEIENELGQAKWIQERYIQCLVDETKLSLKDIKRIINKKANIYFSAEEAVEYGIVDKIV